MQNPYEDLFIKPEIPQSTGLKELQKTNKSLEYQSKEIERIHYENIKLNSQVTTLMTELDKKSEQIENLQIIINKLRLIINSLQEDSKHTKRNLILYPIITSTISGLIVGIILMIF